MVPEDWELTETEDGVELRAAQNPVGLLEITALVRDDRDFVDEDVHEFAQEQFETEVPMVPIQCGDFSGFGTAFESESDDWSVFMVYRGRQFLFATYHCPLKAEAEDEQVDAILATLKVEDLD